MPTFIFFIHPLMLQGGTLNQYSLNIRIKRKLRHDGDIGMGQQTIPLNRVWNDYIFKQTKGYSSLKVK